MKTTLPFRHENEHSFLIHIHPLVRLILPFIIVIPLLFLKDYYLITTMIFITLISDILFKLKIKRILSRILKIFPLIILITIFIPLYIGTDIFFQINLGIIINVYREGFFLALLLFLRIFGAIFIFMSFFSSLTYSEFIEALTKLRIPSMLVGSFIILLHYIPILASSNRKILDAQELRGKKITSYWVKLKTHAFIMGKSFVMNMERSEKLYESLKMRGFSGKITFPPKNFKIIDGISIVFVGFLMILFIYFINLEQIILGVFQLFLL